MATPLANTDAAPAASSPAPDAAPPLSPRTRVARLILIYHFTLIGVSCVFYIFNGFTFSEFTSLMGVLGPITALYGGAVFRFIGRSITEPNLAAQNVSPVSSLVKWLVNGHFIVVLLLISLKALTPNLLNFRDMTMFLTFVESALGVYMGNIILALFEGKNGNGG
ncbi:MAG TPA: hypothetical protein PK971_09645 [Saprospiraceae bacterium]|nr:hypothetical protein [Saprospiraceae bacterium]HND88582.1 hypothetical protein [Saprospiraceae bacterium]